MKLTFDALEKLIVTALEDAKAQNICTLDVRQLTDVFDKMIIATGTSSRHVRAVVDRVVEKTKSAQAGPIGVEGAQEGEWVLVDFGDILLHVMQAERREFYHLESLWGMPQSARAVNHDR